MDQRDIRPPAVAGLFYPDQPAQLRAVIEQLFRSPLGPGAVPTVQDGPRRLLGIIAPHAGYIYSGSCAAWSYAEVARDGRPDAVVILGVNHRSSGAALALSPASGWETPLGIMPVATALGEQLLAGDADIALDARAHATEHSLEVQVPFLQFLFGAIPILPIAMGRVSINAVQTLGTTLARLHTTHNLLIVASTDFSHYVSQSEAERRDHLALEQIAQVNPTGLIDVIQAHDITMCGVLPVATLLFAGRQLGADHVDVLHYYTSGEVSGDRQEVVGYGAAAMYR